MYICPTCGREFKTEDVIRRHFLACWREQNPSHQSKPAPRSEDIVMRNGNEDMVSFLSMF